MASSAADFLTLRDDTAVRLCLPTFESTGSTLEEYGYRGCMYADRDIRSARHIEHMVCQAGSDVEIVTPDVALSSASIDDGPIVFIGSRSNPATNQKIKGSVFDDLLSFKYSDDWTLETKSGNRYKIADPSKLDRDTYSKQTDYGVVAYSSEGGRAAFVVAGLGGRATEGCGLFLRENWRDLESKGKGSRGVAIVLRFPPPVAPGQYQVAEVLLS